MVKEKVFEIAHKHGGILPKSAEQTLDSLGLDSLDTIEIVMDLEDQFDIEISDEEVRVLSTLQNLIDWSKANSRRRRPDHDLGDSASDPGRGRAAEIPGRTVA